METEHNSEPLDDLVDNLLRDKDYLLAQELKQRVAEFNSLLVQAHRQGLKLRVSSTHDMPPDESQAAQIELKIFKEI